MSNRRWTAGAVVVAIAGVAWACGSDVVDDLGDAMVDAGEALRDAAGGDAGAQERLDLPCDVVFTTTIANDTGYSAETTYWYAELRRPEIDPATLGVDAITCDRETFAPSTGCAAGFTCGGTAPDTLPCSATPGVLVGPGVVRVYCGARHITTSSGTTTTSGERFRSARVTLR